MSILDVSFTKTLKGIKGISICEVKRNIDYCGRRRGEAVVEGRVVVGRGR